MSKIAFQADRSLVLTFSLPEYGPKDGVWGGTPGHPRDVWGTILPTCTRREWIAQTLGDAIWVPYEFATTEDRDAGLQSLRSTDQPIRWDTPEQPFYNWWTGEMDDLSGRGTVRWKEPKEIPPA